MKKFFYTFIIYFFMTVGVAFCSPYYSTDIKDAGFGVVEISKDITIYEKPDNNSKKLITLHLYEPESRVHIMDAPPTSSYYFLAKNKEQSKAYLVVTDENDFGWVKVCYSQKDKLYGWIQSSGNAIKSWKNLYILYGRHKGVYIFRDVRQEDRKLYANPFENVEDMKTVENYKHAKDIKLITIKGNWALVRVFDIDNTEKIGYMRWRTDDGQMLLFPKL